MKFNSPTPQMASTDPAELKVLVAEAEKPLRKVLCAVLRELGYAQIVQATNGSEAWAMLRAQGADFVVAGWQMPEMNGMALLKIIRADAELFAMPVFLVSASITKSQVIEAGEVGVSDIILLPLNKDNFEHKLQSVFGQAPEPEFQRAQKTYERGLELMEAGNWQEALTSFQEVLSIHENAEVYYNMGYIKTAQGRYEEAIQFFRRATQIKHDFARAFQKMGECYLSLERTRLAQQSFQKAAAIYMEKQMDEHAEQVLREVLKINPETINVYNNLGIIYRRQGRYPLAIQQYMKALKVNPEDENIYYNLARTYFETKDFSQAGKVLAKALVINPGFSEAGNLLKVIEAREHE